MRTLYHLWLSPFCRKVRIVLTEKGVGYEMRTENLFQRRPEFLALNPACEVPVLVDDIGNGDGDGEDRALVIPDSGAICEYLEEIAAEPPLLAGTPADRAEIRRLVAWFDHKFNAEVTINLVGEKIMKRFLQRGAPDSRAIRAGKRNIHTHLEYIGYLTERRTWLAGDNLSLADIAAAAHLSTVDYLGDVPWEEHAAAKDWYARIKSRPSFRPILADHLPGEPPPRHYADLDF